MERKLASISKMSLNNEQSNINWKKTDHWMKLAWFREALYKNRGMIIHHVIQVFIKKETKSLNSLFHPLGSRHSIPLTHKSYTPRINNKIWYKCKLTHKFTHNQTPKRKNRKKKKKMLNNKSIVISSLMWFFCFLSRKNQNWF